MILSLRGGLFFFSAGSFPVPLDGRVARPTIGTRRLFFVEAILAETLRVDIVHSATLFPSPISCLGIRGRSY